MTMTRRAIRKSGSRLLYATGVALALAGLGAGNALAAAQGTAARPAAAQAAAGRPGAQPLPLVVGTGKGTVRGMYAGDAREFLGIPFAAPPVGALRWRPPQPAPAWAGVRDTTKPGSTCAQTGSIATGVPATSTAEDCLYLNVYTPRTAGHRPLPVMVWIHGGGLTGGAGSIYDGSVLAPKGGVIVVTINYRLSAFGFLALSSLDNEGASGDYGLMDQQAALQWVQRNARAFGGNPRNVTIFGESAGGISVCDNMASPAAAGLFSHAIAESGCLLPAPSRQAAEQQGSALAASLGCTDPATADACLRAKPAASILQAENGMSWAPVASTPVLPLQPAEAFATGRYDHVPLLQGTNHDEGRFFAALEFDALGAPLTAAQYPAVIQAAYGANAPAVLTQYPLSAYPSPDLAFAQVLTDSAGSCPALEADNLTAGSGVYAYEFSDPSPPNDFGLTFSFPLGAAHSTELQYVFQKIPGLDTTPPFTAAQLALSDQMISYWSRFAATGNPNAGPDGGTTPHWPRFSVERPAVQELVPDGTAPEPAAQFAAAHQCTFWAGMGAGVSSRSRSAAAG